MRCESVANVQKPITYRNDDAPFPIFQPVIYSDVWGTRLVMDQFPDDPVEEFL